MKSPFVEFLENHFPAVLEEWQLQEDEWNRLFHWYISTENIFQYMRGNTMIGFVLFRPMRKDQLKNRMTSFEFDKEGNYLYVPLFVTRMIGVGEGFGT